MPYWCERGLRLTCSGKVLNQGRMIFLTMSMFKLSAWIAIVTLIIMLCTPTIADHCPTTQPGIMHCVTGVACYVHRCGVMKCSIIVTLKRLTSFTLPTKMAAFVGQFEVIVHSSYHNLIFKNRLVKPYQLESGEQLPHAQAHHIIEEWAILLFLFSLYLY